MSRRITLPALGGGAASAALALWTGCASSFEPATAPFEPAADVSVSDNSPGVTASVSFDSSLPGDHRLLGDQVVHVPNGWTINDAPDGDTVGSGFLELDLDCNSSPDSFSFDLVREQPPGAGELTAWRASIPGFMDLLFRAEPRTTGGYDVSVTFPWSFHPDIEACTPATFNFTANGSSDSGAPVMTNPSQDGAYAFQMTYGSQPTGLLRRREVCVAIGTAVCPTTTQATPTPTAATQRMQSWEGR